MPFLGTCCQQEGHKSILGQLQQLQAAGPATPCLVLLLLLVVVPLPTFSLFIVQHADFQSHTVTNARVCAAGYLARWQ
jgi:hypothetical protein